MIREGNMDPAGKAERKANFNLFMDSLTGIPVLQGEGKLNDRMLSLLNHFSRALSEEDARKLVDLIRLAALREGDPDPFADDEDRDGGAPYDPSV